MNVFVMSAHLVQALALVCGCQLGLVIGYLGPQLLQLLPVLSLLCCLQQAAPPPRGLMLHLMQVNCGVLTSLPMFMGSSHQ